jgi:hypothetical protein
MIRHHVTIRRRAMTRHRVTIHQRESSHRVRSRQNPTNPIGRSTTEATKRHKESTKGTKKTERKSWLSLFCAFLWLLSFVPFCGWLRLYLEAR